MRKRMTHLAAAVALALGAGVLTACSQPTAEAQGSDAAKVEEVAGQPARITLLGKASQRIGLTTEVVAAGSDATQNTVAESAILYDPDGQTFVYTAVAKDVFVRADVTVVSISDGRAVLSSGPTPGTPVVTVGAAELFGVETGLGGGH